MSTVPARFLGAEPTSPSAVLVLAGGESRRFGSDKLAADVDGRTVLEHALDGLPDHVAIAIVGPRRPLNRPVCWLLEDPPGGGPAAGLVTGLSWALSTGAETIGTLPGDAPTGGRAVMALTAAWLSAADAADASGAIGVDPTGRDQLLLLVLRRDAAQQLIERAGAGLGHGQPVRGLVAALDPSPVRVPLSTALTTDIDTADQLRHFRNSHRT